mmetsp:Transcript_19443/g.51699  ORF Transcript_19443/g.51699 Transcript_19443/m.51699 type:complete len:239 (+) Transcript_19443:1577-2293(+)
MPLKFSISEALICEGCGPWYLPSCACDAARYSASADSSAAIFPSCSRSVPAASAQIFSTDDCSARPYENDITHGTLNSSSPESASTFSVFKLIVASSSLMPPDKNMIPGTSFGTAPSITRTVAIAISCEDARTPQLAPGITIIGFSSVYCSGTPRFFSATYVAAITFSDTAADTPISWLPSIRISGSTSGTSPASTAMAAYSASSSALVWTAAADGKPRAGSILRAARHLTKRAPPLK